MDVDDFAVLESSPIIHWPLILKLMREKEELEKKWEIEEKKVNCLKEKYMKIIEKQEEILKTLDQP